MAEETRAISIFERSPNLSIAAQQQNAIIEAYGVQERHAIVESTGAITKLALSEDGNTIAGAATNTVCLWNTRTRERIERLIFDSEITHMAITGDGQGLIVADASNAIYAIDTSFQVKAHVTDMVERIVALGVDTTGTYIVCADVLGMIRVFKSIDFECVFVIDCGQIPSRLTANVETAQLTVDTEEALLIFCLTTGNRIAQFGRNDRILAPELTTDSLLVHKGLRSIRIFDPLSNQTMAEIRTGVSAADYARDRNLVVTTRCGDISVWNGFRNERVRSIETYIRSTSDIRLCGDSQTIYVCGDDATIDYYSTSGDRLGCLTDLYRPVMAADITASGTQLVVADQGGALAVYELVSGHVKRYYNHGCCISKLCVVGSWAATGAYDGMAKVIDIDTGELVASVECGGVPVQAIALDAKGMLVTGNYVGLIQRYDLTSNETVREYYGNRSPIRSLSISPCGRYLLSTAVSGEVLVFNYESGQLLNRLCDPNMVYTGCFDSTGDCIYYGCESGQVVKAMSTTAKVLKRWQQHATHVRSITVHDEMLCSIGINDDARILDTSTGETVLHCPISSSLNHRVAFLNGDESRLVTGGQDGRITFHDTKDGSALAELHNLGQGFLWTARQELHDPDASDLFWTDRPELIQVYSGVAGIESLLSPSDSRHHKYLQSRNSKVATMARVGMCQEAGKHDIDGLAKAQSSALQDSQEQMLLELHG